MAWAGTWALLVISCALCCHWLGTGILQEDGTLPYIRLQAFLYTGFVYLYYLVGVYCRLLDVCYFEEKKKEKRCLACRAAVPTIPIRVAVAFTFPFV